MSDEKDNIMPAPTFMQPEPHVASDPISRPGDPPVPAPKADDVSKVDHLAEIEQLVNGLHNTSPSGAETIRAQIMEHIGAIRDPKAWDARVAAEKKAADDADVARKKAREDAKAAAAKAEKVS